MLVVLGSCTGFSQAIQSEDLHFSDFSFHANVSIERRLDRDRFLPNPYHFII
jgi:hypothetical protein